MLSSSLGQSTVLVQICATAKSTSTREPTRTFVYSPRDLITPSLSLPFYLFFMKASDIFFPATVVFLSVGSWFKASPVFVSISFFPSFPFSSSVTALYRCYLVFFLPLLNKRREKKLFLLSRIKKSFSLHWNLSVFSSLTFISFFVCVVILYV